jgi:DNA-binding winged helix-turn-helix (wHTH) protein/tetratricopeptide (TPR) repeat protein
MRLTFGEYELDTSRCELLRGGSPCHVEPQVFDVLAYLVENRDRLVTRHELIEKIWGHSFITDSTLSSRVMAARRAIGDSGQAQRLIKTLHGRGFRFIAPVREEGGESVRAEAQVRPGRSDAAGAPALRAPPVKWSHPEPDAGEGIAGPDDLLVGRDAELDYLEELLDEAMLGARRVVFLTGEVGIGRTALLERFVESARRRGGVGVAAGQCVDQHGPGEAYMPVLEAIGRYCSQPASEGLVALLWRVAPTWLGQMPSLIGADELMLLRDRTRGPTREGMLREMVEALESWTAEHPLLLVLEDLHWSDPSTLHLLDYLARRKESARLLVVGTYRPTRPEGEGTILSSVVQELRLHGLCSERSLGPLTEEDTREYLRRRFRSPGISRSLVRLIHARTEGNPLFMRSLVDDWLRRGVLVAGAELRLRPVASESLTTEIPLTLRRLIEQQIGQHAPAEIDVLETASVAGPEFAAAAVAAGLGEDAEAVEARCERLARCGSFLSARPPEEWPEGTTSGRYAFAHHLYREVLYDRIPAGRRTRLHREIGLRLEAAYGAESPQRAAELAVHFVEGRDPARAIRYLHRAAEQCTSRGAYGEAAEQLERAMGILRQHPELPGADRLELGIVRSLGPVLIATRGWRDGDAERALVRARELAQRLEDRPELAAVLYSTATMHEIRGEYRTSQALVEECLGLGVSGDELRVQSQELLACSLFHQGAFAASFREAQQGLDHFDPDRHRTLTASHGANPGISCHYWTGLSLWFLGSPDRALRSVRAAVSMAEAAASSSHRISPEVYAARLHQHRREPHLVIGHSEMARSLADQHGFTFHFALATILRGWARAASGETDSGLRELRDGLDAHERTGAAIVRPYCLGLLAEVLGWADRPDEGLTALAEAIRLIGKHSRSFFWEAELYRLRGDLMLQRGDPYDEAEHSFRHALDVARRQSARSLELRIGISLHRLTPRLRTDESLLRSAYESFGEGRDSPDLQEAERLLFGPGPAPAPPLPV